MEQPTSRPSYMFIPTPIEQKLAEYQLGELLEVYKRGWAKDRRTSKLPLIIITLGALAFGIGGIFAIIDAVQTTNTLPNILIAIPILAIAFVGVGIYQIFQPSLCVGAFSEGLIYVKKTYVTVLYWTEIASCEQKTIDSRYGVSILYKIHSRDGKILKLKAPYLQVENLGKIFCEHVEQYMQTRGKLYL